MYDKVKSVLLQMPSLLFIMLSSVYLFDASSLHLMTVKAQYIGDEVPTIGSTNKDNSGTTSESVVYRPSGVILDWV